MFTNQQKRFVYMEVMQKVFFFEKAERWASSLPGEQPRGDYCRGTEKTLTFLHVENM